MARFFVTGGTGFLGSHFLELSSKEGFEVHALRRRKRQAKGSVKEEPIQVSDRTFQYAANLTWHEGTLTDDWSTVLQQCDTLVHFAAVGVSPQVASWEELFQVNVLDSLKLWTTAANAGIRRFIICGSCFEYGVSGTQYEFIPPDAPLLPTTGYGASKAAASVAAIGLAQERNLEMLILRPFHMFGLGQHGKNFWPSLYQAAVAGTDFPMSPGEQVRDFMAVKDAATAFLDASLNAPLAGGKPIVSNLGSGRPQTLYNFAAHWWEIWKAPGQLRVGALPYRPGEVMRYVPALYK